MVSKEAFPGNRVDTLIFDADDTLWPDQALYDKAEERFCSAMATLGFGKKSARTILEDMNRKHFQRHGISKMRFPTAMAEAYRRLCNKNGKYPENTIERKVFEIGNAVFKETRVFSPGVKDTLIKLKTRGFRLLLLTSGDLEVQEKKIKDLSLGRFFDVMHVAEVKDTAAYRTFIKAHNLDSNTTIMIGNSLKSDILPALEAGLKTIYIPKDTWPEHYTDYDPPNLHKFKGQYAQAGQVSDIPALLNGHMKKRRKD